MHDDKPDVGTGLRREGEQVRIIEGIGQRDDQRVVPRQQRQDFAPAGDALIDVQKIVVLDVPEGVLLARLIKRATLESRADDADKNILRKRFEVYQGQTAETLDHYDPSLLVHINGDQAPDRVLHSVLDQLADFF